MQIFVLFLAKMNEICYFCRTNKFHINQSFSDCDEYSDNSHGCNVNAYCKNTAGSHECHCNDGFIGDERTCLAVCVRYLSNILFFNYECALLKK